MSRLVLTALLLPVQEQKTGMHQLQLKPETLAEMVGLIEDGTISGKIGKEILPGLLQVGTAQVQLSDGSCSCSAALSSNTDNTIPGSAALHSTIQEVYRGGSASVRHQMLHHERDAYLSCAS